LKAGHWAKSIAPCSEFRKCKATRRTFDSVESTFDNLASF
jgi:uncharacterized protein YeaO (DUF488 family)